MPNFRARGPTLPDWYQPQYPSAERVNYIFALVRFKHSRDMPCSDGCPGFQLVRCRMVSRSKSAEEKSKKEAEVLLGLDSEELYWRLSEPCRRAIEESLKPSPRRRRSTVTCRMSRMRSVIGTGSLKRIIRVSGSNRGFWITWGEQFFSRIAHEAYEIICVSAKMPDKERNQILQAFGMKNGETLFVVFSTVLVPHLGIMAPMGGAVAALLTKRLLKAASESLCAAWQECFPLPAEQRTTRKLARQSSAAPRSKRKSVSSNFAPDTNKPSKNPGTT